MNLSPSIHSPEPEARVWTKQADRPLRTWRTSAGLWLVTRMLGVSVPWSVVRQTSATELLAFEARRLDELAAAGEAVPKVVAFDGHTLVTQDVGPALNRVLDGLPPSECLSLMCSLSADLARFHARGQWHGGAQVRNVTLRHGVFHRIDFEEPMHPALPLSTVQVYDALQMTVSMLHWLAPHGDGAVLQVLDTYADTSPRQGEALAAALSRVLPRLRWLVRITGWWRPWRDGRERQRLVSVLGALEAFVHRVGTKG